MHSACERTSRRIADTATLAYNFRYDDSVSDAAARSIQPCKFVRVAASNCYYRPNVARNADRRSRLICISVPISYRIYWRFPKDCDWKLTTRSERWSRGWNHERVTKFGSFPLSPSSWLFQARKGQRSEQIAPWIKKAACTVAVVVVLGICRTEDSFWSQQDSRGLILYQLYGVTTKHPTRAVNRGILIERQRDAKERGSRIINGYIFKIVPSLTISREAFLVCSCVQSICSSRFLEAHAIRDRKRSCSQECSSHFDYHTFVCW